MYDTTENLTYMNKGRMKAWVCETGLPFPPRELSYEELSERGIYCERDLSRVWSEHAVRFSMGVSKGFKIEP